MKSWRNKLHEIIFEADTKAGKTFDIYLLIFILLSLFVVMLDSVEYYHFNYGKELYVIEWVFTFFFTIEYILRVLSVKKPLKYILSFYGVIDLLSILPTFIGLFYTGAAFLKVFRSLRFLRLFKVFKLNRFTQESKNLTRALKDSQAKIIVFIVAVLCLCMILGSIMYVVEGKEHGFTSIPMSIYWTIVTLTTVGYGDISPETPLGQLIASIIMVMGYGIIAVPTGIVTAGVYNASKNNFTNTKSCSNCSIEGHANDATFCKYCGEKL